MNSGETVIETLTEGDIDTYTFAADAHEKLFLTVSEQVRASSFNPGLFVYGPSGTLVGRRKSEKVWPLNTALAESVVSTGFNPGVFVYGPDDMLVSSVPSSVNGAVLTDIPTTQAGTYTIVIRDASGNSNGDYSILVNSLVAPI